MLSNIMVKHMIRYVMHSSFIRGFVILKNDLKNDCSSSVSSTAFYEIMSKNCC